MSGFWTCHECGAEMYGFENCQFCGAHKGGGEAMSKVSSQVASLRLMARLVRDYDYKEISRMLREAADTIESLRDRLQDADVAYNDAEVLEDVAQALFRDLMKADPDMAGLWKHGWPELFGGPEKAVESESYEQVPEQGEPDICGDSESYSRWADLFGTLSGRRGRWSKSWM